MQNQQLYDLARLTSFRHDIHKHAELSFEEHRTSAKIVEYLTSLGIRRDQIRSVAKTGLIVDIIGTAQPSGHPISVALRADMDALPIQEDNPDLDYQCTLGIAHACGHDMHVTCLLGATSLVLEKLDRIPNDKKLRLLFQPAEETEGGALTMVEEGAMNGIDEVYAFHVQTWDKPGKLYVKKGYLLACCSDINIVIHGKGGHSSIPDQLKDPLQPAVDIHVKLRELIKEYKEEGETFVLCLPVIKTGNAPNAISDTCVMTGSLRSFDENFTKEFHLRLRTLIEETCAEYDCRPDVSIKVNNPAVFNTENETEHVMRVGRKLLGEANVIEDDRLPELGSEDFSFFNREKPGAYFYLSAVKRLDDELHTSRFDANDDLIPLASKMWLKLIEDRFDCVLE